MPELQEEQLFLVDPSIFMARAQCGRAPREMPDKTEPPSIEVARPVEVTQPAATPLSELIAAVAEEEEAPSDCVFMAGRKLSASARTKLLEALASHTGGEVRSQYSFESRVPGDRGVLGRLEGKLLMLQFQGRARSRWFTSLRQVATDFGLVEPD